MDEVEKLVEEALVKGSLVALVLSGARGRREGDCRKVLVKPLLMRGQRFYQFAYHYPQKVAHRNLAPGEAKALICTLLAETFRQGQFYTREADCQVLVNKKGGAAIRTRPASRALEALSHNRKKNYLLAEDQPRDFLIRLGVMNADGTVAAARYDKFRQINRFLEIVDDVEGSLPRDAPLRIVDFGCGKSYLTFALYHYLHALKQRDSDIDIVGLDLKQEVVAHCNEIAQDLHYANLTFVVGDMKGYESPGPVDMVVTLHACDTATDDALVKAVAWGAKVILSVPCCQHELFRKIDNETMRPMLKHGIVRERLAALVTDSVRANLLETAGYSVQIVEFIDREHTAKNLLIRAVKQGRPEDRVKQGEAYRAFRDFWNIQPYMEAAMREVEGRSHAG